MKERPIIFQPEMVEPIPTGLKQQTRRLNNLDVINEEPDKWNLDKMYTYKGETWALFYNKTEQKGKEIRCPYGIPGDLLWVRESFCEPVLHDGIERDYYYKAEDRETIDIKYIGQNPKWKPSIHMPKVATRYWLENTEVRLERVHHITDEDAIKEGLYMVEHFETNTPFYKDYLHNTNHPPMSDGGLMESPWGSFQSLWIKINGQESWDRNPWVWVINFKQVTHPNQQPETSNQQNQQP